jgi:hypothetical protein
MGVGGVLGLILKHDILCVVLAGGVVFSSLSHLGFLMLFVLQMLHTLTSLHHSGDQRVRVELGLGSCFRGSSRCSSGGIRLSGCLFSCFGGGISLGLELLISISGSIGLLLRLLCLFPLLDKKGSLSFLVCLFLQPTGLLLSSGLLLQGLVVGAVQLGEIVLLGSKGLLGIINCLLGNGEGGVGGVDVFLGSINYLLLGIEVNLSLLDGICCCYLGCRFGSGGIRFACWGGSCGSLGCLCLCSFGLCGISLSCLRFSCICLSFLCRSSISLSFLCRSSIGLSFFSLSCLSFSCISFGCVFLCWLSESTVSCVNRSSEFLGIFV